jgi:hypothetical protein
MEEGYVVSQTGTTYDQETELDGTARPEGIPLKTKSAAEGF